MRTVNLLVLVGLIVTGMVLFISYLLRLHGNPLLLASYFTGYVLVCYSIVSFFVVGLFHLMRRKRGFFQTLYPLNALIGAVGVALLFVL